MPRSLFTTALVSFCVKLEQLSIECRKIKPKPNQLLRLFSQRLRNRDKTKSKPSLITFDTELKTALTPYCILVIRICIRFRSFHSRYDEYKDYNFRRGGWQGGTGHFTQVVWKGSKELGMGRAKTADGSLTFVVGRYRPAGNVINYMADNVFPRGGR